jgi:hypothetical protein
VDGDPACVERLRAQAPSLSMLYFGCPVYLVGGALTDPDPRDLDVVVPLPDDLFVQSYGEGRDGWNADKTFLAIGAWCDGRQNPDPPAIWRRWARDCAKQSEWLTAACHRRVDFKAQPAIQTQHHAAEPRRLLFAGFGKRAVVAAP